MCWNNPKDIWKKTRTVGTSICWNNPKNIWKKYLRGWLLESSSFSHIYLLFLFSSHMCTYGFFLSFTYGLFLFFTYVHIWFFSFSLHMFAYVFFSFSFTFGFSPFVELTYFTKENRECKF